MFSTKHFNLKKILKPDNIKKSIQTFNQNTNNLFITINNMQNSYFEKKLNLYRLIDDTLYKR